MQKPDYTIEMNLNVPVRIECYGNDVVLFYTDNPVVEALWHASLEEEFESLDEIPTKFPKLGAFISNKLLLEHKASILRKQLEETQSQLASVETELRGVTTPKLDGSKLPPITGTMSVNLDSNNND